ncbi:MAG TPA: glycosyltransferase family 2 protein [Gemmatimonadaceae bacterium]|nr:glycosyltransferase family 2 protein [Gemmatimonadaceae bacterium]
MIVLSCLIGIVAVVLLLPVLSDLMSLVVMIARPVRPPSGYGTPALLFLVPAHDEELLIGATIASLQALQYPNASYEVVVIADNCTDGTASVANAGGVRCLERRDTTKLGKPFAIDWALAQIDLAPFDAMVIIDADCIVDSAFATAVANVDSLRTRAAQTYIDIRNRGESALTVLGATFSVMRFRLMNALKRRAGLTVPFGNGLVLGMDTLRAEGWQAFSICEDWEEYALLTARGVDIENVPAARTYVQEARSLSQSGKQRRRWAAGKFDVLFACAGHIVRSRHIGVWQKLDALAELSSPGPVVALGISLSLAIAIVALHLPAMVVLLVLLTLPIFRLAIYAVLALRLEPDPWPTVRALSYLPLYLVWRLIVQLSSLTMIGRGRWERTERHSEEPGPATTSDDAGAQEARVHG